MPRTRRIAFGFAVLAAFCFAIALALMRGHFGGGDHLADEWLDGGLLMISLSYVFVLLP